MSGMRGKGKRVPRPSDDDDLASGSTAPPESVTASVLDEQEERVREREPMAAVRRSDDSTGRSQFLDTVPLAQVDEEWLAETYGGGKYQVMRRGMKPDGKWGYVGHETYVIDESLPFKGSIRKQKEERAARGDDAADGRRSSVGSRMDSIIEGGILGLMRKSEETSAAAVSMQMQMMREARESSQANSLLLLKVMESMGNARSASSPVVEALIAALAPAIPKLLEVVMTRKDSQMVELLGVVERLQPKSEGAKLNDALDMIRKLREAAVDVTGDVEPASPMLRVVERLAEFLPALMVRQQPAAVGSAGVPVVASGVAMPEAAVPVLRSSDEASVPVVNGPDDVWRLVGERIDLVRSFAAMGGSARRVAAMAVELATLPQRALMREVLASESFAQQFFEHFPQMETYRSWTQEFIEELRFELFGDDGAGDDDDAGGAEGVTP